MSIPEKIVGRVGAAILRARLPAAHSIDSLTDGPAVFRLDRLSNAHMSAIVLEILADPGLAGRIDIRIPRALVQGSGLPADTLTDDNAGAVRNQPSDKAALLTANGNEPNLADTLEHVAAIGAAEFHAHAPEWVDATLHATGMALTPEDHAVFRAAIQGLLAAEEISLYDLAEYCSAVSESSTKDGEPIRTALGWGLPYLRLPRDSSLFANSRTPPKQPTYARDHVDRRPRSRAAMIIWFVGGRQHHRHRRPPYRDRSGK
ncbi:hypothetical protein [Paraburkholderia aspalathi]|uniref:hypothetical protein n=1 Tax=Paraburkholderia aspalathi TaxID=1324617 RepID=UPI00190C784D|nr:hypothetical protein [Paraburkholderia aspalathi]MBK3844702.1 hypothetical protein [Paraburkholderia aspalathi]